jgi:hypothetical protein
MVTAELELKERLQGIRDDRYESARSTWKGYVVKVYGGADLTDKELAKLSEAAEALNLGEDFADEFTRHVELWGTALDRLATYGADASEAERLRDEAEQAFAAHAEMKMKGLAKMYSDADAIRRQASRHQGRVTGLQNDIRSNPILFDGDDKFSGVKN